MNPIIAKIRDFVRTQRFWLELGVYVVLGIGSAAWIGTRAYREAAILKIEGQRLEGMRISADRWITTFQPATSGEIFAWQRAESGLHQLGAGQDSRLTLVEVITRRAERAGLRNVRTTIISSDSIAAVPRMGAGKVTFGVASYSIGVDVRGNLAATRVFLASLPPAVSVQSIVMTHAGQTTGTHAVLTVYEAVSDVTG